MNKENHPEAQAFKEMEAVGWLWDHACYSLPDQDHGSPDPSEPLVARVMEMELWGHHGKGPVHSLLCDSLLGQYMLSLEGSLFTYRSR